MVCCSGHNFAYSLFIVCAFNHNSFPAVAVVGLEQTFFRVSENVGMVELCARVFEPDIQCPIEFPFSVSLSTSDGTAGK